MRSNMARATTLAGGRDGRAAWLMVLGFLGSRVLKGFKVGSCSARGSHGGCCSVRFRVWDGGFSFFTVRFCFLGFGFWVFVFFTVYGSVSRTGVLRVLRCEAPGQSMGFRRG